MLRKHQRLKFQYISIDISERKDTNIIGEDDIHQQL